MRLLTVSRENKYILLIGDQFSWWHEAITMNTLAASLVAKAFLNVWVSRLGCLANLHGDKGINFLSDLVENMCQERGINRTSTTAYHHQGITMREQTNRTIEESHAKYVAEQYSTWSG